MLGGSTRDQARRAAWALALIAGVIAGPGPSRASPLPRRPASHPTPGLVIGTFKLGKIVDGDTLWVDGLASSLRLIGIDTEETFKSARDRRAAAAGLAAYMAAKRGGAPRPVKMATPMGEAAKRFAVEFFAGVGEVRLERDDPAEVLDRYQRYLAYVFVERDGGWVNYNVACVRAGMAPYFTKYGFSRRFHAELAAAEAEAKAAGRGIWAPDAAGYPDYAEREAWWAARGAFIEAFRAAAATDDRHIDVMRDDAATRLAALVGEPVSVLGTVGDVWPGRGRLTKVTLAGRAGGLPLVFFDRSVLDASGVAGWRGEPVIVTGRPRWYEDRRDHRRTLEIIVERADQVTLAPVPGLVPPARGAP